MVAPYRRECEVPIRKQVSMSECHHFFLVDMDFNILADIKEQVLVFLSYEHANRFGKCVQVLENGFQIVGMGDRKWELFQRTETYRIVEDE